MVTPDQRTSFLQLPGGSVSQVLQRDGPMPERLIACYARQLLEVEPKRCWPNRVANVFVECCFLSKIGIKHQYSSFLGWLFLTFRFFCLWTLNQKEGLGITPTCHVLGQVGWAVHVPQAHGFGQGLNYLHTREPLILHRDVKGGNILVGEKRRDPIRVSGPTGPDFLVKSGRNESKTVRCNIEAIWQRHGDKKSPIL